MMIYVSRSFPAEVGERRDKDTREKFQRSLRTTQHTQQTRAFTLVVRSHRFGSSSLIFYLNSTNNSTIIYTYSFSDERFSLSCDLSLNRLSKVSSVPFKTTRASFRFSQNSPLYSMMMQKRRSVMCCFKKKKTKGTKRERKKTGE
jgi:hypothetical protein